MTDLHRRFATLDRVSTGLDWADVEREVVAVETTALGFVGRTARAGSSRRVQRSFQPTRRVVLLAAAAILAAMLGGVAVVGSFVDPVDPVPAWPLLAPNGRILVTDGDVIRSYAPDGSDGRALVQVPGGVHSLSISPDGTRVAYTSESTPGGGRVRVTTIADGTTIDVASPAQPDWRPVSWSPDGRSIAFAGGDERGQRVFVVAADGSGALQTPGAEALGDGLHVWQPQFSPDGAWISFITTPGDEGSNGVLYLMRPDGTGLREIMTGVAAGDGGNALWSPDPATHLLAYTTIDVNGLHQHVLDVATGVTQPVADGFWASWSPDGSRLAYWSAGGTTVVNVADLIGGRPVARVHPFTIVNSSCADYDDQSGRLTCYPIFWSPDGTFVVAPDFGTNGFLIAKADGSSPPTKVDLTSASGFDVRLAWQPLR